MNRVRGFPRSDSTSKQGCALPCCICGNWGTRGSDIWPPASMPKRSLCGERVTWMHCGRQNCQSRLPGRQMRRLRFQARLRQPARFWAIVTTLPLWSVIAMCAVGVYNAAKALQLTVPDDHSVVGIDDSIIALILDPELTTVAIPARSVGQQALRLLLKVLRGSDVPCRSTVPLELVIRKSTALVRPATRSKLEDRGAM